MSREGHGLSLGQMRVVLVVPELECEEPTNLQLKRQLRERGMLNLKYNIKSYIF
jgi:hypothetical protein